MKDIITIEDLTVSYDKKPVLWDIDLNLKQGQITGILGPNGAGKSTLLKSIMGSLKILTGSIKYDNEDINSKNLRKNISYIPQKADVNWDFPIDVSSLVLMARYVHKDGFLKRYTKEDYKKAEDSIELMGLTEFKNRQISKLSGGQKQRAFIARAICQDANVFLMDEPFAGVDKKSEKIIMDYLKDASSKKKTTVIVHHDLNTVKKYFDRIVFVNKKIIAEGSVEEAFTTKNINDAFEGMKL
ncbi:MAG: metal ABC transporter ATP-binding protein [Tissierellia bacterium]|nr:metal ABC transporter ATP-binding protein [Tissierellia bacterium]